MFLIIRIAITGVGVGKENCQASQGFLLGFRSVLPFFFKQSCNAVF